MAIIFTKTKIEPSGINNITITATSSLAPTNGIIQVVDNQATISGTATGTTWLTLMTTSITITLPNSRVMVEYFMNERKDAGNGNWSLTYHRILRNGIEVMNAGHSGAAANHIGFYGRTFLDTPGAGTHTYTAQAVTHSTGSSWLGNTNSGSTNHYLRLFEIGK
jgi:hypothetical protein